MKLKKWNLYCNKRINIDGNTFIPHAIKKGAKIIVTENSFIFDDVTTVK